MCGGENSFFEDVINVVTQGSTAGIFSYESDKGGFTGGGVTMKGAKELTGAKAAEDANTMAREQMEQQKAQMLQERENAKAMNAADQIAKSRQASAVRSRSGGISTGKSSVNVLGGDERDFLGV